MFNHIGQDHRFVFSNNLEKTHLKFNLAVSGMPFAFLLAHRNGKIEFTALA